MTLHYEFPKNLSIDEVREIVNDNNNFYIGERDGYIVVNYLVAGKDTHPPVIDRKTAIMRELRGLVFDSHGHLISRRLHKFFNLGEREDVAEIDVSKPHVVLEKLDGSMITPFIVNGELRWGTKMGLTEVAEQVEKYIQSDSIRSSDYERLALVLLEQDCTPIFEWCSRVQKIVIDYPEDKLVLIAIRDNMTGEYVNFDRLMSDYPNIPQVNTLNPISDLNLFTQELRKREDIEGVVIRFADGHMVKVKTDTYIALHRAKSELESERNVVRLILENKVDDLLPLLTGEDYVEMVQYTDTVNFNIQLHVDLVNIILDDIRQNKVSRKDFALSRESIDSSIEVFVFKHWNNKCTRESVIDFILRNLGSNRSYKKCHKIIVDRWKEINLDV
jgi:RNA ligase